MKIFYLILTLSFPIYAQIVLSEIMFDLDGTDTPNEFVECYNLSQFDTVDLGLWKISDLWSLDECVDAGMGTTLPPLSYAVILEGDHDLMSGIYGHLIPDTALLLKVDDNSIGNQLSASDSIFIINADGDTVDRAGWQDISAPGFSLERRRLDLPGTDTNWTTSLDSLGTPGFLNSVSPPERDAAIVTSSISHTPLYPEPDQVISLKITIYNLGIESLDGTLHVIEKKITLVSGSFEELETGDSVTIYLDLSFLSPGIHTTEVVIDVAGDTNPDNDSLFYEFTIRFVNKVAALNEFHYAPDPGIPEFIELVNLSLDPLNLKAWAISDSNQSQVRYLPSDIVPPAGYAVISHDSSLLPFLPLEGILLVPLNGFPSLNNAGDAIYLFEPAGTVIDSLVYTPEWGGENGRSVEKFNPFLESSIPYSWGTCVTQEKMTPCTQNSVFFESSSSSRSIKLQPNPFSPDGDGFDDLLRISYTLPFPQAFVTIQIFNSEGRIVHTLAKNLVSGSQGMITWDGLSNRNRRARIGLYLLKMSAIDRNSKRSVEWIKEVVVAEPLR